MEGYSDDISENTKSSRETNTYLTDVGRGWEGEFLSVDVEGHSWHLCNVVTVDHILRQKEREKKVKGKWIQQHLGLPFSFHLS